MSKIVVADLYQLLMLDGKPSKDHKKIKRENVKVQASFVEATNKNWQDTALLYVVDEKKTKEYYAKCDETNDLRRREKDLQQAANVNVLKEVVGAAIEGEKSKKVKEVKTKTE